jgi:hypothetical protein
MKRWGKLKPVRFDEKELNTFLESGNFIFVGSSCDMWADDIPSSWIETVLSKIAVNQNSDYFFQSKNPKKFIPFQYLLSVERHTFCTTLETDMYWECMANAPKPIERAEAMKKMSEAGYKTMVTIEPILDFSPIEFISQIKMCNPSQVNIGADSGNNHLPEPPLEKVIELILELEKFTTVHRKKNLGRLIKCPM